MEPVPKSEDENNAILRLVAELCRSITWEFVPVAVTWLGNFGQALSLPSDQCVFLVKGPRRGFVVMPEALKGKLSLDEWKPIVASGLIISFQPKFRRIWRRDYGLMWISILLSFALLFTSLILNRPLLLIPAVVLVPLGLIVPPKLYNYYTLRRLRLRADRKAAELVGREQFLQILVKIDGFHLLDVEELKRRKRTVWQRHVFPWPTITERIDNLRK